MELEPERHLALLTHVELARLVALLIRGVPVQCLAPLIRGVLPEAWPDQIMPELRLAHVALEQGEPDHLPVPAALDLLLGLGLRAALLWELNAPVVRQAHFRESEHVVSFLFAHAADSEVLACVSCFLLKRISGRWQ